MILASVALLGCTVVGPDYESPVTPVPDGWTRVLEKEQSASKTGAQKWWADFNDPDLTKLIATARKNNPDLKRARARIEQAWHQRRVIRAAFFPHSDFFGRQDHGLGSFDRSGIDWDPGSSSDEIAQVDVGWEIDLFGGISRQVESVTADYEASIEGWRDFHVIVTAEVALHYIALRTLDARLAVSRDGAANYKEIADLTKVRKEEGVGSDMDVLESSARLKQQESKIPKLEAERAAILSRLAALVGTYPAQATAMIRPASPIPTPPRKLSTGLPADLLRSRPDIRRAERKLQAQSARIGMATANLYPSLSLSGAITYERSVTKGITDLFRRDLGLGPTLRWRIFHACADQAKIKEQEAGLEMELAQYEEVVLTAVAEVEESLAGCYFEKQVLEKLSESASEYQRTAELMTDSYRSGLVDLRRLLNARQDAIDTRDEASATRGRLAAHSVKLFKALGGGPLPMPKGMEPPPSVAEDQD
ncbi:efflux transporter outer membrane subunit [Luteolibacter algae]|uniref:Efflux transporter outer membrane subunit n=1 Tax=Luteolibacter algae TaxID=454151 RepID=A0ABW5D6T4_9BACT